MAIFTKRRFETLSYPDVEQAERQIESQTQGGTVWIDDPELGNFKLDYKRRPPTTGEVDLIRTRRRELFKLGYSGDFLETLEGSNEQVLYRLPYQHRRYNMPIAQWQPLPARERPLDEEVKLPEPSLRLPTFTDRPGSPGHDENPLTPLYTNEPYQPGRGAGDIKRAGRTGEAGNGNSSGEDPISARVRAAWGDGSGSGASSGSGTGRGSGSVSGAAGSVSGAAGSVSGAAGSVSGAAGRASGAGQPFLNLPDILPDAPPIQFPSSGATMLTRQGEGRGQLPTPQMQEAESYAEAEARGGTTTMVFRKPPPFDPMNPAMRPVGTPPLGDETTRLVGQGWFRSRVDDDPFSRSLEHYIMEREMRVNGRTVDEAKGVVQEMRDERMQGKARTEVLWRAAGGEFGKGVMTLAMAELASEMAPTPQSKAGKAALLGAKFLIPVVASKTFDTLKEGMEKSYYTPEEYEKLLARRAAADAKYPEYSQMGKMLGGLATSYPNPSSFTLRSVPGRLQDAGGGFVTDVVQQKIVDPRAPIDLQSATFSAFENAASHGNKTIPVGRVMKGVGEQGGNRGLSRFHKPALAENSRDLDGSLSVPSLPKSQDARRQWLVNLGKRFPQLNGPTFYAEAVRRELITIDTRFENERENLQNRIEKSAAKENAAWESGNLKKRKNLVKERERLQRELTGLDNRKLVALREALRPVRPARVKVKYSGKELEPGKTHRDLVEEGVWAFRSLVSLDIMPAGFEVEFRIKDPTANPPKEHRRTDATGKPPERASVNKGGRLIELLPEERVSQIPHELAHSVEMLMAEPNQLSRIFYDRRTWKQTPQELVLEDGRTIYIRPDLFADKYMGRAYGEFDKNYLWVDDAPFRSHEVLSIGVELFWRDPLRLARGDEDTFHFVYEVINGRLEEAAVTARGDKR
jgi:hypothetical protein